jgi:hypothetical protein
MRKNLLCIIIALLCVSIATAQDFKKVQVTLKNGQVFKGKKGTLTNESVSFLYGSAQKTFPLNEVNLVQTKEGKAGKWALGMGGGCLGVCVITLAASGSAVNDGTYTYGQLIAGSVIWVGIFTGAGVLIGSALDHWNNAYISKVTSQLKNFDLNIGSTKYAKYNVGFSYRF